MILIRMGFSNMKKIKVAGLFVMIISMLFYQAALAETRYVAEIMQITLRTGKSLQNKIVAMLDSGQRVNVLASEGDWSLVRLADGKEGWVLTRFLTAEEPKKVVLERLQKQHETMKSRVDFLSDENKSLKEENHILKTELDSSKEALEEVTRNYQVLKEESAEFIDLKASEQEARAKMEELVDRVNVLESEASRLRMQQNIRWFLAGAGVLFAGFLIGTISRKKRRRSSLLT